MALSWNSRVAAISERCTARDGDPQGFLVVSAPALVDKLGFGFGAK